MYVIDKRYLFSCVVSEENSFFGIVFYLLNIDEFYGVV